MSQAPTSKNDTALRGFVGYRLKRAMNVISSDLAVTLKPFGLRMITFSALAMIVETRGIRLSQLSELLSVERPNLVAIVDELQKRGLIERKRDETDRRAYGLFPTPTGLELFSQALAAVQHHEQVLFSGFSDDDIAQLTQLLARIENIS